MKHLGLMETPKRSTLAYANEHRPWELYQTVFGQLLEKCRIEVAARGGCRKFRFKNKLMSLDSSIIDLSVSMFDWAKYRRIKGAIKLHLLLDHQGYLPWFAVVTEGKHSELEVARSLRLEAGTILAIDRGYNDYQWFCELTAEGVFFVTRMKTNSVYVVEQECAVPARGNVLRDQIVSLPSLEKKGEKPALLRRIECWNPDKLEILVFFTNLLHLSAATIAAIYNDRWAVELFFKVLKQTRKVKTFLGTSVQAVKTQIWTALIAMLILKYLQMKSSFGWPLSYLAVLLRQQLFIFRDLWAWWNAPWEGPSATRQLGMTATPRREENRDTYLYFGEPVYTYLLKEGINDGFLTPFKVRQIATTLDEYVLAPDDRVIEGEVEAGHVYTESDFNKIIEIRERKAYRVKLFMDQIDQREKTLVFCASQDHALMVRDLINQTKTSTDPNYCHRVTADDQEIGNQHLREFQDNDKTIPTILTSSQKLSTGVDARNIRNIVLMRPINSMIEFKQIIGRGTRLYDGKDYFTIYDFGRFSLCSG